MSVVVISFGARGREGDFAPFDDSTQFAHRFDPTTPEGVPMEARNFILYAAALPRSASPHILLAPPPVDDERAQMLTEVRMSDWTQLVETATGVPVVIA